MPVLAVFSAPGPHPPQINSLTRDTGQRGEIRTGHGVGKQIAPLEIDRHDVRGQFADLAARYPSGRGQGARGLVEVFGFWPGTSRT